MLCLSFRKSLCTEFVENIMVMTNGKQTSIGKGILIRKSISMITHNIRYSNKIQNPKIN